MRKKVFFVALASIFFGIHCVNAASTCSYSEQVELSQAASNVTANYEIAQYGTGEFGSLENQDDGYDNDDHEIMADMFKVNIFNLTSDLYIKVKTSEDKNKSTNYNYDQATNGTITLERKDLTKIVTYTIEVYSNHKNCVGDNLRTFEITTPKYNVWSTQGVCSKLTNFYYCQEYTLADINITQEEFSKLADEQLNKQESEEEKDKENKENETTVTTILDFLMKNKIIIINVVIILIGVLTTAIIYKNRRSKKL